MSSLPPPSPAAAAAGAAAARPPGWGPTRTLAGLGIFLVALIVEAGVISAFDSDLDSLGAKLTLQALLAITLVAVAFGTATSGSGIAAPEALGLRRPLRSPVRPAILAYLVYVAFAIVIAALIQPEQEDVTRELGLHESAFGAIAAAVLIVVAAPLSEEIFFRGFMFSGIRRRAPFAVAAISSAAVWGLFHYTGPGSWGVCLQLAIFGVILAWLYERTGSIWPTIAVHMFNNALAFAILAS
jgi:membrane protease YdiL (CAAX protease family)